MYKIIIVDDEEIVRRSIVKKIKWEDIGFDTPYQACQGLEALELALQIKPDLVFADIKMPIMDGLELANKLHEQLPETQVVIFSGYDEFKYAQESISLGILDYILKPLGSVTLTNKFIEIKEKLDMRAEKKDYIEKMKDQLHKSLPLLKESFLNGLVCAPASFIYSKERMASLDIDFGPGPYIVCAIEPIFHSMDTELIDVLLFGIKNIIAETIGSASHYFTDSQGKIILIISYSNFDLSIDKNILIKTLMVLHKAIFLNLKLETTIGIGNVINSLNQLNTSYTNALSAIEYKYSLGSGNIYDFNDFLDLKDEFYYPYEFSNKFITAVKSNKVSIMEESITLLLSDLKNRDLLSLPNLKFIFIELVTELTKLLAETKNSSQETWSKTLDLYRIIEEYDSSETVAHKLLEVALDISDSLSALSISSRRNIVLNAMEYIKHNYADPEVSLKHVASIVAVSAGHLSAIFKAEGGINFNTYLNKIRIDHAKELLATTHMTVYDIAYSTGHSSPHYFSISFKKNTGMTPSEYRHTL